MSTIIDDAIQAFAEAENIIEKIDLDSIFDVKNPIKLDELKEIIDAISLLTKHTFEASQKGVDYMKKMGYVKLQ